MDTSTNRLIKLYNEEMCITCKHKGTDCVKTFFIEQKQRSASIKCDGYKHK